MSACDSVTSFITLIWLFRAGTGRASFWRENSTRLQRVLLDTNLRVYVTIPHRRRETRLRPELVFSRLNLAPKQLQFPLALAEL